MRLTIAIRLLGVGVIGVAAVGAVAFASYQSTREQGAAAARMAAVSQGMSEQWNADMMHDGIRADVMAALVARTDADRRTFETDGVAEHATMMLEKLDRAARLAPAQVRPKFAEVRPRVVEYGRSATRLVALAAADPVAARAQLPDFLALFGELEESLGGVDESMEQAVRAEHDLVDASARHSQTVIVITWVLTTVLFVVLCSAAVRAVLRPLRRMRAVLAEVAAGNFVERVHVTSADEIGELARAVDVTLDSVQDAFRVVEGCIADIASSAEGLQVTSRDLSGSAAQTSAKAAEAVDLAMHVSEGAQAVASGIEQVSAQTRDIAGSAGTAADVGRRAVDGADAASRTITRLGDSSSQISGVAAMIRSIADQTRLLALNATIEAARAGEAGRGFAVVASEVKELAQEVGRATEDISSRIAAIQSEVEEAVADIATVSEVIAEINAHQRDIATAVDAQAHSSGDVATGIDVAAREAGGIVGSVMVIAAAAEQTSETAQRTAGSASGLAETADRMRAALVGYRF